MLAVPQPVAVAALRDQSVAMALASARSGNWSKFYDALRQNPVLISARDPEGHTPMHWFALNNHKEAVKKLLSIGADVCALAAITCVSCAKAGVARCRQRLPSQCARGF